MKSYALKTATVVATLSILLAACAVPQPTAAPTTAPAAPAATEAPTEAAAEPTAATEATSEATTEATSEATAAATTEATAAVTATEGTTATTSMGGDFTVGFILVGPANDKGWSEAHVAGSEYVTSKMPNVKFEIVDKVNPADRPNVKGTQVADDLIAKGAKMIVFTSDDFKDDAIETAKKHPETVVIHASGDSAWSEGKNFANLPNLGNLMPRMEPGWMIAGCAAALGSANGKIGNLGPLINDETRRYASAAFLGAKYCWTNYLKKDPAALTYKVTWIGFWFNIPGVTLDPTKVADDYYNGGFDVVMNAIDTPEAAIQAKKAADAGKAVKFVHYDYRGGCDIAPDLCLGVNYYNWGPGYAEIIKQVEAGTYKSTFTWMPADWNDFNNADTSAIGFIKGNALGDNAKYIDEFIKGLGDGSISPYKGPLNFQDGTPFLKDGETATDLQIWYMPQLLEGMEGASVASN